MVEPIIDNLRALAEEIAQELGEKFGSEHLAKAVDKILFGPAYYDGSPDHPNPTTGFAYEEDNIDDKLQKLFERSKIYLKYDRYLAENGYQGNREIDAPIKRLAVWDANIGLIKESGLTPEEGRLAVLSLMCKTNGLFLGREVLNRDFTFFTHGPVFDFFVQKNPYISIAQQDTENKMRLLEMPRGSFKSVSDGIDCVQWIICHPDVRIMFLTASLSLAKDFVREIKNYFMIDADCAPTPFQAIFARDTRFERAKKDGRFQALNFLVSEDETKNESGKKAGKTGKENEFICPARTRGDQKKKEVTIWAGSVGAGKVGKHCNVVKADDAVDEKNTDTPQLIAKTKKRIGMAFKLVDAGGFKDNLGTPYAPNDWYNHIRMDVKNVLTLIRPCKWLKKDLNGATAVDRGMSVAGHEIKEEKDLVDGDWTLLFPCDKYGDPKLTHDQLRANQEEDPEGFPSQYMLDPHGYKKVTFTEALLYRQTVTQLPEQIEKFAYYVFVDLADTQTIKSDYSVFAVMAVDRENRGYVVEIFRDRYTLPEICYRIAKLNHDYKPVQIVIEDARGASKLKGDMVRASQDMGDKNLPLNFVKVSNVKSAKAIRVNKLGPKLNDGMLFFLNTISCYEDLIREFRDFGSDPHDDIPDAIGYCMYVLPDSRSAPLDPAAAARAQQIMNDKAFYETIYNSSPEQDLPIFAEPLPDTEQGGTGNDSAGDLYDPYSVTPFRK